MTHLPKLAACTAVLLVAAGTMAAPAFGGGPASRSYQERVFKDVGKRFHGGPPPHTASAFATDFRVLPGKPAWDVTPPPTVQYTLSTSGCATNPSSVCGGAATAINAGLDAWQLSGVTFTQNNATTQDNPCSPGGDDPNSVSFAQIDGAGGTAAVTFTCHTRGPKPNLIVGFDIVLDQAETWDTNPAGTPGKLDIQHTATHEAGHVIGLDHVSAPRAARLTMFPFIAADDTGYRTLGCGDRLGVNALYGTTLTCTTANVPED
jgi:Matrixin